MLNLKRLARRDPEGRSLFTPVRHSETQRCVWLWPEAGLVSIERLSRRKSWVGLVWRSCFNGSRTIHSQEASKPSLSDHLNEAVMWVTPPDLTQQGQGFGSLPSSPGPSPQRTQVLTKSGKQGMCGQFSWYCTMQTDIYFHCTLNFILYQSLCCSYPMSLLPAPRSGPLMPGRTAEDGIVAAWDTKLHKHCGRAGGMLFFSFPASKKTWTLVCSLLFLEPSWTAQLELIRIEKVKAFRRMSALQLPVSWMRNQENPSQWFRCAHFIISIHFISMESMMTPSFRSSASVVLVCVKAAQQMVLGPTWEIHGDSS